MKKSTKKFLITLGVLVFVSLSIYVYNGLTFHTCCAKPVPPAPIGENLDGEADPNRMALDMTVWRWIDSRNPAGKFSLALNTDGTFVIWTDCNSGSGTYTSTDTGIGGAISLSPIVSTEMACGGSHEAAFKDLLQSATAYQFNGRGQLILDVKGGAKMMFN
ncbi:MAG TPA: META domain-containing protein [Candidatus Paceibacterota bacterium]